MKILVGICFNTCKGFKNPHWDVYWCNFWPWVNLRPRFRHWTKKPTDMRAREAQVLTNLPTVALFDRVIQYNVVRNARPREPVVLWATEKTVYLQFTFVVSLQLGAEDFPPVSRPDSTIYQDKQGECMMSHFLRRTLITQHGAILWFSLLKL